MDIQTQQYTVILFYKFVRIDDPDALMRSQKEVCQKLNLKGRMLIANEGVNGTFEGTAEEIEGYKNDLRRDSRFSDVVFKESKGDGQAFSKLKVKVRDEIVTLGVGQLDIKKDTAKEISADELEALYKKNEDFVVLDLRNDYEIDVGYFDRTVDPRLRNFRDLPEKLEELKKYKNKKVIAVCTGGVRCEKATCLLTKEGFTDIYQLKDGIHTYMQKYPGKNFKGTLFVFDNRVMTPVVDTPDREIVGECSFCRVPCENVMNDDSGKLSVKVICCAKCALTEGKHLRKYTS